MVGVNSARINNESAKGGDNAQRQSAVRGTTRKLAGNIAARETVKHVHSCSSRFNIFGLPSFLIYVLVYVIKIYIGVVYRSGGCIMGMMGVFKWFKKDIVHRDRSRRTLTPKLNGLNNEAYRNALQAFIDRRRGSNDSEFSASRKSTDKERNDYFIKRNNDDKNQSKTDNRDCDGIHGIPHINASEIFEIGWVAGTEDRLIELIFAEWQTTRVSLRRPSHPDCRSSIKADLEVLTEIRHPNILLLMATTHTDDHGLVAIFEPIDCTLFNYIHEQGERISVQGIAKCAGSLAAALKHANMRGYVHGAISSHCVYLAASGMVKLGGWELAGNLNSSQKKVTRGHEERLKYEIYRWLAPEIHRGGEVTKATDVFGLSLLMWEMCTTNVPWSGLSRQEVEKQYVQCKRGVITDLYTFPPLLNNLLDAGLQLDVDKRTLDIIRMRRFLQTLQIQFEDADPIYVELSYNNNINNKPNNSTPKSTPMKPKSPVTQKSIPSVTPKLSICCKSTSNEKENFPPRLSNLNDDEESKKSKEPAKEMLSSRRNESSPVDSYDQILKGKNFQKVNSKNVHKSREIGKFLNKVRKPPRKDDNNPVDQCAESADETSADPRSNIKKLKEVLASKRENFFYGTDSLKQSSPLAKPETPKNRVIAEIRSQDYAPHKPASHKTSIEPKQTKLQGDFNSIPKNFTRQSSQTSAHSYVPTAIRDAVLQPEKITSNSGSFFERSLWKKEKMICISKMRKGNEIYGASTYSISRYPPVTLDRPGKANSIDSNCTYTVDESNLTKNPLENPDLTGQNINIADLTASTIPRSKSLQALKDALERATDIVRSTTPHPSDSSSESSPLKSPKNCDLNKNISGSSESIFEDLYKLNRNEPTSEVKRTESSPKDKETLPVEKKIEDAKNDCVVRRRKPCRDEKRGTFEAARLSGCRSIAENHNENEISSGESKADDRTVILSESALSPEALKRRAIFDLQTRNNIEHSHYDNEININGNLETSFALMIFNDKNHKECNSCSSQCSLARRRSLPAALGHLRNNSHNGSIGKLPIRKAGGSDNTVEDLYIDDEFGESLNVNMVLLDEDTSLEEEEFSPDLIATDSLEYR